MSHSKNFPINEQFLHTMADKVTIANNKKLGNDNSYWLLFENQNKIKLFLDGNNVPVYIAYSMREMSAFLHGMHNQCYQ